MIMWDMTILAHASSVTDREAFWPIVLTLGLVVVLAVILLLSILSTVVRHIDENVHDLWTMTKRLAQNTTGLYQLAGTGSILRALREEALRQDKLLSKS